MLKKVLIIVSCILGVTLAVLLGNEFLVSTPIKEDLRTKRFYESEGSILYRLDNYNNKHSIIENKSGEFERLVDNLEDSLKEFNNYYELQLGYIEKAKSDKSVDNDKLNKLKEEVDEIVKKLSDNRKQLISYNEKLDLYYGEVEGAYTFLNDSVENLISFNKSKSSEGAYLYLLKSKERVESIESYKGKLKEEILGE